MRFPFILLPFISSIVLAEQYAMIFGTADDWDNYSITSEPCRMYTDLIQGGIKPENIILMTYTTNLNSSENPYPGKIFTDPAETTSGDWAQYGCFEHVDYTNEDINGLVFLAILSGDAAKVKELTGKEHPKVLAAGPEDTVFTYFIDHGLEDFIAVGNDLISHSSLFGALKRAYNHNLYGKWVWFMEACFSGSMFNQLPSDWNIFVMTSSDAQHPAEMSNCPPDDVVAGKELNTCMSGLWDNAYLTYLEQHPDCTIGEIVDAVTQEVAQSSDQNVSHWGDMTCRDLKMADFVGVPRRTSPRNDSVRSGEWSEVSLQHDSVETPSETPFTVHPIQAPLIHNSIPLPQIPYHLAKWKSIRSHNSKSLLAYQELVYAEAKREVEVMRLGRFMMSEQAVEKAIHSTWNTYSIDCVRDLSLALVKRCGHSFPFPANVVNVLHAICVPGIKTPIVDFEKVCI